MPTHRLRPRSRRGKLLALLAAVLGVLVAGFLAIYFLIFPTSSPKPFKLTPAGAAATTAATTPTSGASATTPSSGTTSTALSGSWQVASGSLAGYRVREQLAFLPAESDAVGRTSQITGSATFSEHGATSTATAATLSVAVNTLKSDRSMRDEKIHSIGLESDRYPTATFTLTRTLAIPASALHGHVAQASAAGSLEIHGQTRNVTIPLEIALSGGVLQIAGHLTFPWSEFGMSAPSIGGFVTVTGKATMEFDLHLQHA